MQNPKKCSNFARKTRRSIPETCQNLQKTMSRSITYIAPVESMRGNLSGSQNLVYPTNDNKAYQAPEGRAYARNYKTRYIGALRSRDGKAFFAVKRRSATRINSSTKLNMALLGATQAILFDIKSDSAVMAKIGPSYTQAVAQGLTAKSLNNWMSDIIRQALYRRLNYITFTPQTGAGVGVATNPFNAPATPQAGSHITKIKNSVLVEFWDVLAPNGIYFTIDGAKGVARSVDTFQDIVNAPYDVLSLDVTGGAVWVGEYNQGGLRVGVMSGDTFTPVSSSDVVSPSTHYTTQYGTL